MNTKTVYVIIKQGILPEDSVIDSQYYRTYEEAANALDKRYKEYVDAGRQGRFGMVVGTREI